MFVNRRPKPSSLIPKGVAMRPMNVVLAHHDPVMARALAESLRPQFRKLVIVNTVANAEAEIARLRANYVIVDLELFSYAELQRLCSEFPSTLFHYSASPGRRNHVAAVARRRRHRLLPVERCARLAARLRALRRRNGSGSLTAQALRVPHSAIFWRGGAFVFSS